MSIRIVLADDHAVVRSGLRRLLEQKSGWEIVAEAESGEEAYQRYIEDKPDVLIMDLSMPGMGGLEAMRRIIARDSAARVLIFSMHDNAAFANQALSAGARGYISKSDMATELIHAVEETAGGGYYLSPALARKIVLLGLSGDDVLVKRLSAREFEVFRLLAEGRNVDEIGHTLNISQKTAANYQSMVKQKLNISSPVELVRLAIRYGLISQ